MHPRDLLYQSPHRGMEYGGGKSAVTYFGVTYRIPQSQRGTVQQLEWEQSPRELLRPVTLDDGSTIAPVDEGAIERIETLDQATGDLLVMYRIPYQMGE